MRTLALILTTALTTIANCQDFNIFNIKQEVSPYFGATSLSDRGELGGSTGRELGRKAAAYINSEFRTFEAPFGRGRGLDINNGGTLVGYHDDSNPTGAYWTSDGTYHPIPLLPGGTSSIGLTIEDDGTIAGIADGPDGPQMAIWRNGEIETFGWIPTRWNAGVRDYGGGKFIGDLYGTVEGDFQGSFIFDTLTRRLTTYATSGDENPFTLLWDINNLGHAVGEQSLGLGNGYGGVLIDDSGTTSFGTSFKPEQISDSGQMAGRSLDDQEILLYRDGVVESLDELIGLEWDTSLVWGINNRGQILAQGYYDGSTAINQLLLTPVPEPGTLAAFLVGGALLRWKRRQN